MTVRLSIRPLASKPCCRWNVVSARVVLRAEHAIHLDVEEPFLLEYDLDLPDFVRARLNAPASPDGAAPRVLSSCVAPPPDEPDRYHRDDLTAAIDNHDLVTHDEVLVSAPLPD